MAARIEAIAGEGATATVVDGGYDDAVRRSARDAGARCLVISDTSWEGYEQVPGWVIDGYATVFDEIEEQLRRDGRRRPDVVAVPIGVGALAAAVVRHFWAPGGRRPALVGVEPTSAACVLESVAAGRIVSLTHPQESIMAGLNCATPSLIAWPAVSRGLDAYVAVPDARVPEAMALLADDGIAAGETGAGGLAGMLALSQEPQTAPARRALGLGPETSVLLLCTEWHHRPRRVRAPDRRRAAPVSAAAGQSEPAPDSVRAATLGLLRRREMTTIFGNPGSTELALLRDFPSDFRYVLALHESVAVAMADGYAQATGRPAFVNLHSACGVGNAMGAVVNAFHNRAPLVITAGNQDRRQLALEPYLFARSVALMAPYAKHSEEPARAQDVPAAIDRAWALAQAPPRGPVFVSVPSDDWSATVDGGATSVLGGGVRAGGGVDAAAIEELVARLSAARAPAIVVGAGADRDGAWSAVTGLAQRLAAPVWAAPQSGRLAFPEDHPQYQGHLAPGYASAAAQLADADVALVLGAPVFAYLPYEPGDRRLPDILHVTDDPDEAARAPSVLSLVADVRAVAQALLERLPARSDPPLTRRAVPPAPSASEPIAPAFLMAALAEVLHPDAVLVEEAPSHRNDLRRHVRIRRPASFFASASGGLGFAMPAAVGIKLAQPGRDVVCLVGDGSALYAPQALWSAVRLPAPVTFIVVNNARYAILESVARFAGLPGVPSLELPGVDFVVLARSFGCAATRVTDADRLRPAIEAAVAGEVASLIEVVVDPAIAPLLPE